MAGRHKLKLDAEVAAQLALDGSSNREIAEFLGTTDKTIAAHFSALLRKMRARRRHNIRTWQNREAEAGNTAMLIWLGKNELDQSDKHEPPVTRVIVEYADRGIDDRDPDEAAPGPEDDPA